MAQQGGGIEDLGAGFRVSIVDVASIGFVDYCGGLGGGRAGGETEERSFGVCRQEQGREGNIRWRVGREEVETLAGGTEVGEDNLSRGCLDLDRDRDGAAWDACMSLWVDGLVGPWCCTFLLRRGGGLGSSESHATCVHGECTDIIGEVGVVGAVTARRTAKTWVALGEEGILETSHIR